MRRGRIQYLIFEVSDLERSRNFYENVVGFVPSGEASWIEQRPNVAYEVPAGQHLVLVQVPTVRPMSRKAHTGFSATREEYQRVQPRVAEALGRPRDTKLGGRSEGEEGFYFNDPDGNRLQITVWASPEYRVPAAGRGRVVAGRIEDFAVGSITYVPQGRFYLLRHPGGLLALNEVCTHQLCRVRYQKEHHRFYCACHGREFDGRGDVLGHRWGQHLDTPPLETYAIDVVDGQVVVDTDRSLPQAQEDRDRLVPAG